MTSHRRVNARIGGPLARHGGRRLIDDDDKEQRMNFEDYTRSLDALVLIGRPPRERVEAAYRAGADSVGAGSLSRTPPSNLKTAGGYLWDRIEAAFEMGRQVP